jgi:hypothetical protein
VQATHPAASPILGCVGTLGTAFAFAALTLFTTRVFRPGKGWATTAGLGLLAAQIVGVAWVGVETGFHPFRVGESPELSPHVLLGVQGLCALWTSFESLAYHGKLRRQLRLGLVDAMLVNRFLLFGVAFGAVVLLWLDGVAIRVLLIATQIDPSAVRGFAYVSGSLLGLLTIVTAWITFFPPAAYTRFVLRRAATEGV